jgi:hypothetical protein
MKTVGIVIAGTSTMGHGSDMERVVSCILCRNQYELRRS